MSGANWATGKAMPYGLWRHAGLPVERCMMTGADYPALCVRGLRRILMVEERFKQMQARYDELTAALSQPDVTADISRWQEILIEMKELAAPVAAWLKYEATLQEISGARELLDDPAME